jgi:sugar/nucleoside kinase (ribokinase family)
MGAGDSFFASFVVSVMRNGYLKEGVISEENLDKSFEYAAKFSANVCLVEGAFGFGVGIEESHA